MSQIPQCILILNSNQINAFMNDAKSAKGESIEKRRKTNNNHGKTNIETVCSPYFVIPQNSLISMAIKPEKKQNNQFENPQKKSPFTCEEDKLLLQLVENYGKNDWKAISILMKKFNFNRNTRQCKDRYYHYLDPSIKQNFEWTKEEDDLLLNKVIEIGNKWKTMESFFPGRTEISLRNRFKLLQRKESKDERKKDKKKKNIMSDEFSFLDNFCTNSNNTNCMRDKNVDNAQNGNESNDIVNNSNKEFYSSFSFDQDILFDNEFEQESSMWIDEHFNEYI